MSCFRWVLVLSLFAIAFGARTGVTSSRVPAIFAFGDSLVDSGNNNHLLTPARSDYPPYGVDLADHMPTGRFSDGQLVIDVIATYLNLPPPPPYLGGGNMLQGANFASASAGIRNGTEFPGAISLWHQINNFQHARIPSDIASKAIFYICIGNNDVNNYWQFPGKFVGSVPEGFQESLIQEYARHIERLYSLGARKFVIVGLSAFGCIPMNVIQGACDRRALPISANFNTLLKKTVNQLQRNLAQTQFVITDFHGLMVDVNQNPARYGFLDSHSQCCVGTRALLNPGLFCDRFGAYCPEPATHAYWDAIHNSQAFNQIAAARWWNGSQNSTTPMSIQQLAAR